MHGTVNVMISTCYNKLVHMIMYLSGNGCRLEGINVSPSVYINTHNINNGIGKKIGYTLVSQSVYYNLLTLYKMQSQTVMRLMVAWQPRIGNICVGMPCQK